MKLLSLLAVSTALLLPLSGHAAEPTEKDAIAMVEKGAAYLKAHETAKTIDSKIILQVETLSEKQWVTIKELRSVNHG